MFGAWAGTKTIPCGVLNLAATPLLFSYPGLSALPAIVVTIPD